MNFHTPLRDATFSIPDEWWSFVCTEDTGDLKSTFYPYALTAEGIQVVDLTTVEPPRRDTGEIPFKKYKLVPVLLAFQSPECELPSVEVIVLDRNQYLYRIINGYHRYYASVAVGYKHLPVMVRSRPYNAP